jgi:hypothetical protein
VLEEKKNISDAPLFAEFDKLLLKAQSSSVIESTELEYGNH